jgi:hypothetical protein
MDQANNGLIYGYSFYLDCMAANWDALILNDYEVVMPLTWKKKYGFYYLYQPFLTASLGLFGNNITAEMVTDFLKAVPPKFKYWDIYLNHANRFILDVFDCYDRVNYVLPLHESYESLFGRIRLNHKQSIKKAEQLKCRVQRDIDLEEVLGLAQEQGKAFSRATTADYDRFRKLFHQLHAQQKAITYGVYMASGQLAASGILFFSHKRAYYILAGNHPNGKTIGASNLLIHTFIKDFAGQDLLLDFEGSDIPSLAFFYGRFGAKVEMYTGVRLNKLPKIVQLIKR